jgi:iron complex outermembrane recepter protein
MTAPIATRLFSPHHRTRPRLIHLAVHAALLGLPMLTVLPATVPGAQAAEIVALRTYDIPSGPLAGTLLSFAQQAGIQLSINAGLTAGLNSKGLHGQHSLASALAALLGGTGLEAVNRGGNEYTLRKLPIQQGDTTLAPLTVTAGTTQESAWGPVRGYVAKRNASTKGDTSIMETAQSISVVTRDQMDDQAAQTVTDALRYVAGVNTSAYGEDSRYDWITVRGFNQSVFGLYRDGLKASASKISSRIDAYGLERIEVLKGPASVLYGQNAPGGLVNSITKRPTEGMQQEISVGVGNHERKQVQFDLGGSTTLRDDNDLIFRLTGNVRDSNTQMDYAPDDHTYIAPALTWKIDATTSLTILANYQKDKAAWGLWYPRTGTLFESPWGQIKNNFYPGEPTYNQFNRTQSSIGTLFEKEFGEGVVFRQGLRFEQMSYDAKFVRGRALLNDSYDLDESGHLLYRDANHVKLTSQVQTIDNQLNWTMQTGLVKHNLLAGLDASRTHYEDRQYSGSAPILDLLNPVYGQTINEPTSLWARDVTALQTGLYLQDRLEFNDWIIRGGIRHDWATTDTVNPAGSLALHQKDDATTYQAGILYRGVKNLAPFINYAESFQPVAQASQSGEAYQPTTGRSVEAGIRYQPEHGRGMLTASLFRILQNNVLTQDPTDSSNSIQTGQIRSQGLELEGNWDISRALSMVASYTFLDAEVTRSTTPGQLGTRPQDAWGTTSPRHMASLWLNYRFQEKPLHGFSIGGGIRYMGSTLDYGASTDAPDNNYAISVKTPAYTLFDVVLGYEPDQHWRFQVKVNNLFDKLYIANPCGASQLGTCYYGPERNILATAAYRW